MNCPGKPEWWKFLFNKLNKKFFKSEIEYWECKKEAMIAVMLTEHDDTLEILDDCIKNS